MSNFSHCCVYFTINGIELIALLNVLPLLGVLYNQLYIINCIGICSATAVYIFTNNGIELIAFLNGLPRIGYSIPGH